MNILKMKLIFLTVLLGIGPAIAKNKSASVVNRLPACQACIRIEGIISEIKTSSESRRRNVLLRSGLAQLQTIVADGSLEPKRRAQLFIDLVLAGQNMIVFPNIIPKSTLDFYSANTASFNSVFDERRQGASTDTERALIATDMKVFFDRIQFSLRGEGTEGNG